MTEIPEANEPNNPATGTTAGSPTSAETTKTEHMIPISRFNEVNERYKALAAKVETMESDRQKQERQALEDQQKYKELYEQTKAQLEALQQVQQVADRYKASLKATNDSRVEQIPEEKRHLVPEFDDPVTLSAWLDKALPDLSTPQKPKAPTLNGGAGGSGLGTQVPALSAPQDALADIAAQYGYKVDKERIAQYAKSPLKSTNEGDKS